jgi:hypothetical protein
MGAKSRFHFLFDPSISGMRLDVGKLVLIDIIIVVAGALAKDMKAYYLIHRSRL